MYDALVKLPNMASTPDKMNVNQQVISISRDFLEAMSTVGRIIISERYVKVEEKTIKPIDIGGFLGGSKYLVHGILFKYAISHCMSVDLVDSHGLLRSGIFGLCDVQGCWT